MSGAYEWKPKKENKIDKWAGEVPDSIGPVEIARLDLKDKKITFEWKPWCLDERRSKKIGTRFFGTVTEAVQKEYNDAFYRGQALDFWKWSITKLKLKDVYISRNCNENVIWEKKKNFEIIIDDAKNGIKDIHEISENDLLEIQEALKKQTIHDLKNIFRTLSELKKGDENYNLITTNLPHWLKENSFLTKYREALTHLQHFWTTFDAKNYTDKDLWEDFKKAANSGYPWKDGEKLTINKTTKKFNISTNKFEDMEIAKSTDNAPPTNMKKKVERVWTKREVRELNTNEGILTYPIVEQIGTSEEWKDDEKEYTKATSHCCGNVPNYYYDSNGERSFPYRNEVIILGKSFGKDAGKKLKWLGTGDGGDGMWGDPERDNVNAGASYANRGYGGGKKRRKTKRKKRNRKKSTRRKKRRRKRKTKRKKRRSKRMRKN